MIDTHGLELSAEELQKRNLSLKRDRESGMESDAFAEKLIPTLQDEKGVRVVTVCFSDLEGKLHMLDYNKDFFLKSLDNLTFDGSSINGFTELNQSDLRLFPDWTSFRWLPSEIFGAGKTLIFASVANQDGTPYEGDMRNRLRSLLQQLRTEQSTRVLAAPEIEGFLLEGVDAEQQYCQTKPYELATKSGYFSSLPQDDLRIFIDDLAQVLGTLGFENEKDHPEVAPSQFELNFRYTDALATADNILLYKLCARQVAKFLGFTASFLPKPFAGMNGNGMHTNISLEIDGKNIFFDGSDGDKLSQKGRHFAAGVLQHGEELCLIMNPSVNAYRRLDPNFEAPNEIKMSSKDRGSMIRIPIGNERSARIEVRTVAPDANPYLSMFSIIKAGLKGIDEELTIPEAGKILPENIHLALESFRSSEYLAGVMGKSVHRKYADLKQEVADRAAREHGNMVKTGEVIFHHEVKNQYLWNQF